MSKPDYLTAIRALLDVPEHEGVVTAFPVWEDGVRAVIFAVFPGDDYPEQKLNRIVERLMLEPPTQAHDREDRDED